MAKNNIELVAQALNKQEDLLKALTCLNYPNRKKIYGIIKKIKKPINISHIYKEMNPNLPKKDISYKSVYMNIKVLEKARLIKLTKNPKASGQEVLVEISSEKLLENLNQLSDIIKQIKE